MNKYIVHVYSGKDNINHLRSGTYWYKEDGNTSHRLEGPAVEFSDEDGGIQYWVDGHYYPTKDEYDRTIAKLIERPEPDCLDGKIVEIEGKKYKLTAVKE